MFLKHLIRIIEILDKMIVYFSVGVLIIYLIVCLGLTRYTMRFVPTKSMNPTIMEHSFVVYDKKSPDYQRGDVIDFYYSEINMHLCKRIIAGPGDTYRYDDKVWINGEALDEPYLAEEMDYMVGVGIYPDTDYKLGEDEYVVMGDNRNCSLDSRDFGTIKREDIRGRVVFVYNTTLKPNASGPLRRIEYRSN